MNAPRRPRLARFRRAVGTSFDLSPLPGLPRRADQDTRLEARKAQRLHESESRVYSLAIALCVLMLALVSPHAPLAEMVAATLAGGLLVLSSGFAEIVLAATLIALAWYFEPIRASYAYWSLVAAIILAGAVPRGAVTGLLTLPRWSWIAAVLLSCSCYVLTVYVGGMTEVVAQFVGSTSALFLGVGLARHLAMIDARLLAWGEGGLNRVTRELLLGRVTSGMLHDLAQPLNVISMANGNLRYIVEQLDIPEDRRIMLMERIGRIAQHTEATSGILDLFRWFGRDFARNHENSTVRSAIERALEATRSNVHHREVDVTLVGDGLDYLLPDRHGALEMLAVAALLCAFDAFLPSDHERRSGAVRIAAALSPAHVVVTVASLGLDGEPLAGRRLDNATRWLIEELALDAAGDFRSLPRGPRPDRFVIRLGRDDT